MTAYIIRRLLLIFPTLFGIMAVTFLIVQFAPGGPVEQVIAQLSGTDIDASTRVGGGTGSDFGGANPGAVGEAANLSSKYRGAQGLDPEFIKQLEAQFGFDKPPLTRFFMMVWDYLRFDFGDSYFQDKSVISLIIEKMPVSISLGFSIIFLSYGISIPLGIRKAVKDGTNFDLWTSAVIVVGYAIPGFLLAVLLIVLFASDNFLNIFPLRGLVSDNYEQLTWYGKIFDRIWHLTLPIISMGVAAFATTTFLTKNSFLDEIKKQYVMTARAKGLTERSVLYGHVFRNAMLIIIAGFPAAILSAFFTGSILIETIFSLDGLGLLSFESIFKRDYAVVFASLYILSLLGLFINLISDIVYSIVDPRIDFESRET